MLELILFFEDNQRANNMTTRRLTTVVATTLLSLGLAIGGSVSLANEEKGNAAEHKFELARQYYGQCAATDSSEFDAIKPQLRAFTDMEVMAETMADPAKFMQLMAVVNDPRSIHVMTKCATEPVMWDTWMSGMTDFNMDDGANESGDVPADDADGGSRLLHSLDECDGESSVLSAGYVACRSQLVYTAY
jgi:hypothetical protein